MRNVLKKLGVFGLAASLGVSGVAIGSTAQPAAAASSTIVISEVYGGGGNSGATHNQDFIELYNLSAEPVSLEGLVVDYFSAGGNSGGSTTLPNVTIEPGNYYLVGAAYGNNTDLPGIGADHEFGAAMSGSNGAVELRSAGGERIDLVGFGSANLFEGQATPSLSNSTSASRIDPSVDTDNNNADFSVGAPTPQNSAGEGEEPAPTDPVDPVEPGELVEISEIQGSGDATPFAGQDVTTQGVVTAVYTGQGSKNGFYIQEPGDVDLATHDASTGVFVYGSSLASQVAIGDSVEVTGEAEEYFDVTQIGGELLTVLDEDLGDAVAVALPEWPATDAERELFEGMLLDPQGSYLVTDNYSLNQFGEIGLGYEELLITPTEVGAPGSAEAAAQAERNDARGVLLDDGQSWNYMTNDAAKESPLPYLTLDTPVTIGAEVGFESGVVLDYGFDEWRFQPTEPVHGAASDITFSDVREDAPALDNRGDVTVATFNVLNYFTSLGEDEAGCQAYTDREGNLIAANWCDVRGAYSQDAFEMQEDKIVTAIENLDASVISLEEIEDTSDFGGHRDDSLATLVDALNEAAGSDKWAYVATPADYDVPTSGNDVIRTAFIYQPAEVTYVEGTFEILDSPAFTDGGEYANARAPLAASFIPAAEGLDTEENQFIVIGNHFKSKGGSGSGGNANTDDNVGGWNLARTHQAQALVDFADDLSTEQGTDLVFLTGDINAYSAEDPITTITDAGYEHLTVGGPEYSYSFGGTVGSLDHVFASPAANDLIVDGDIWTINANEPIALEYSRYNYNVADLYAPDQFRSSDHNPAIVALDFDEAAAPVASGSLDLTVFEDENLDNTFTPDSDELQDFGYLYLKDAEGNWYAVIANDSGSYEFPELPVGQYEAYVSTGSQAANSAVWFNATTLERLPLGETESVMGQYFNSDGEWQDIRISQRTSPVLNFEITEDAATELVVGTSSIEARATVVESGTDAGRDDLATVEFIDGDTTYESVWSASGERFFPADAEGRVAFFLDDRIQLAVTPVAGYEVVDVTADASGVELDVTVDGNVYSVARGDLPASWSHAEFTVEVAPVEEPTTPPTTEEPTPTDPTETPAPVEPTLTLEATRYTQTESLDGVAYRVAGLNADGAVRVEVVEADGTVTVIEDALVLENGVGSGAVVYQTEDGTPVEMPIGDYTLRVTQEVANGEDIVLEEVFAVVADAGATPAPTETPGETATPGETSTPGDDADDDRADDRGEFDGTDHGDDLAQTGADNWLVLALALGAVLVLAGAGVLIQRRRA